MNFERGGMCIWTTGQTGIQPVGIPNNFDKDDSHAKKLKINSV